LFSKQEQTGGTKQPKIALITILTDNIGPLVRFYRDALGFRPRGEIDEANLSYTELESEGVRFAVCPRSVMAQFTMHASFSESTRGQAFELAFPCESPAEVDTAYAAIVAQGATPVQSPANMPWGQRSAFFADPDGNIHELFADLPRQG
jgi:lactoylglutathione lyase